MHLIESHQDMTNRMFAPPQEYLVLHVGERGEILCASLDDGKVYLSRPEKDGFFVERWVSDTRIQHKLRFEEVVRRVNKLNKSSVAGE